MRGNEKFVGMERKDIWTWMEGVERGGGSRMTAHLKPRTMSSAMLGRQGPEPREGKTRRVCLWPCWLWSPGAVSGWNCPAGFGKSLRRQSEAGIHIRQCPCRGASGSRKDCGGTPRNAEQAGSSPSTGQVSEPGRPGGQQRRASESKTEPGVPARASEPGREDSFRNKGEFITATCHRGQRNKSVSVTTRNSLGTLVRTDSVVGSHIARKLKRLV